MGKLQDFQIILTDNKEIYSPGESISGTLNVTAAQNVQCKAIKVNCNGFCGVTSKENDTSWAEEEQYFNSTVSVADKGTLREGKHSFPFKFLIPATAPTSYEGPFGRVLYRIRAFVDTPRFAKDYKTEKPFYMHSPLDLNDLPDIRSISASSVTKEFSYNLLKNGVVKMSAQSDLRGYTPGQVIKVSAEIDNQSGKSTSHVTASLMQRVTYKMKKPLPDVRAIAEVEGGKVKGGKKAEWKDQIIVPPLPQSPLRGCSLIDIDYFIQVSLKYPDTLVTLPVHIGNIPVDTTRPAPTPSLAPGRPVPPTPSPRNTLGPTPALEPAQKDSKEPKSATKRSTDAAPGPSRPTNPSPKAARRSSTDAAPAAPSKAAPTPAPRPRPRSTYTSPSAPPAELPPELLGRPGEFVPRMGGSHQGAMSPSAFSYAPGLIFPPGQNQNMATAPQFQLSPGGAVAPFAGGHVNPVPMAFPVNPPPDYRTSDYPHEAPPSYEDSCVNT